MTADNPITKPRHESALTFEKELRTITDGQASTNPRSKRSKPERFDLRAACARAVDASLAMGHGVAWLVFALGGGLVLYFSLPNEPNLWALLASAAVLSVISWKARAGSGLYISLMIFAVVLGLTLGTGKARLADAPQLLTETTGTVTGRIVRLEQRTPNRARLTLDDVSLERTASENTPRRIRLTVIASPGDLAPGDSITVLARLGPPPEPVMPGARNMRRELYFAGIGATGFSYGRPTVLATPAQSGSLWQSAGETIAQTRLALSQRFRGQLDGDTGILASALLVGKRDGLSDESYEALRRAGLAHLLAISGMHMAMMTLSAIAVLHLLLAFHPSISASSSALRWAGVAGLLVATGYLMLSGASTATQRAFVMITIALIAMMATRRALTIRAVAFAALIVLALHPESLLGPSFQMSFAATLALVAVYGAINGSSSIWRMRMRARRGSGRWMSRPLVLVGGIALTSLIAGFATAPFAAYHFSVGNPLGLIGNVLALPLVSLIIMPAGLLALLLTPFALEGLPLAVMGFGIDQVMMVAHSVAAMEASRVAIPAITPQTLVLLTLAGCLAAFLVGKARLVALPVLLLMPIIGIWQPVPTLIIERSGATVAHVTEGEDRQLDRSVRRGNTFAVDMWHQRLAIPSSDVDFSRWLCDPLGCILPLKDERLVAHVLEVAALAEDCTLATILITPLEAPEDCSAPLVIDRAVLRNHGAIALIEEDTAEAGFRVWRSFEQRTWPWERVAN